MRKRKTAPVSCWQRTKKYNLDDQPVGIMLNHRKNRNEG